MQKITVIIVLTLELTEMLKFHSGSSSNHPGQFTFYLSVIVSHWVQSITERFIPITSSHSDSLALFNVYAIHTLHSQSDSICLISIALHIIICHRTTIVLVKKREQQQKTNWIGAQQRQPYVMIILINKFQSFANSIYLLTNIWTRCVHFFSTSNRFDFHRRQSIVMYIRFLLRCKFTRVLCARSQIAGIMRSK